MAVKNIQAHRRPGLGAVKLIYRVPCAYVRGWLASPSILFLPAGKNLVSLADYCSIHRPRVQHTDISVGSLHTRLLCALPPAESQLTKTLVLNVRSAEIDGKDEILGIEGTT